MEFKKIPIDRETFENIVVAVHEEFMNANEETWLEDLNLALSEVIFDVKPSYVEDEWNSCEVVPPIGYNLHVALVRIKVTDKSLQPSQLIGRYRLGIYYRDKPDMFFDYVGRPLFNIKEEPSDFEYKFIEE